MIKAIETKYKGYTFRSRLEARWAVFFDALGIKWEYEPEGYVLSDGTYYLPDFYLPEKGIFVEIKGQEPTDRECRNCALLADGLQKLVYIFIGLPTDEFITTASFYETSEVKGYKFMGEPEHDLSLAYWMPWDITFCSESGHMFIKDYLWKYDNNIKINDNTGKNRRIWVDCDKQYRKGRFDKEWNGYYQYGIAEEIDMFMTHHQDLFLRFLYRKDAINKMKSARFEHIHQSV